MAFKAKYFDGKTSKTHHAEVTINSLQWTIRYMDDESPLQVNWSVEDIKKSDVFTKGFIAFTYGKNFPFQRLESDDVNFISFISNHDNKNFNRGIDTKLHQSSKKTLVSLIVGLIGLVFVAYLYVIPAIAENFAANLSQSTVTDFGNYVYRVLSPELNIDDEKSKKLQGFVDELEFDTEFNIEAYVANSDQLNAFALSGGKIVIFSSLLEKLENKEQLVALIGHEVAHIEKRHVLKNVSRNLSGAVFISILFGDVNSVTAVLADNAHMFSQLSFSRSLEKEADIYGLEIMKQNNVDLNGMPELFKLLKRETDIDIPSYLSNHPMLKNRIDYTTTLALEQDRFNNNYDLEEKWNDLKSLVLDYEEDKLENENSENE